MTAITMKNNSLRRKTILRVISLIFVILILEIIGRNANPLFFAPPSQILVGIYEIFQSGELIAAIQISTITLLIGLVGGALPGILFGVLMGRYKVIERIFEPYVNAIYATPLIALIPLVLIWFGNGMNGKVIYIILWVVFPVLVNTYTGVKEVNNSLLEVAKSFGAKERQVITHVIFPYVVPYIVSGIRLAVGRAIVGLVVAEMSLALSGFGGLLMIYGASFAMNVVLGVVLILTLYGVFLTELVHYAEKKVAPWKVKTDSDSF